MSETKIIGFLISKDNCNPNIDIFKIGMKIVEIKYNDYYIYLWGLGDIENYKINNKYTLSFPLHENLLDRNVVISFQNNEIFIENDWLGSIPVFYNFKNKIVSTLSNLCVNDKIIHTEGLSNFGEFGYSVFEQTFFEDVKFMRYYSKLIISSNNIEIKYKQDPILNENCFSNQTNRKEVVSLMKDYILNIENQTSGDIILPTSGGNDSRILNYLLKNKSRIKSFTYGISQDQSKSTEVIHAKKISEIYNTSWSRIELKDFHNYINQWVEIYGISTHAHGMYHIELYTKILEMNKFDKPTFLSGIIGDGWAELGKFKDINSEKDMIHLGYTHGANLDLNDLNLKSEGLIKKQVYETNKEYFKNEKTKAVFVMRTKIILLSYLTQIPEYFGMPTWTPFLNFDIVKATLSLPDEERKNRLWQKTLFKEVGLDLENMNLKSNRNNSLIASIMEDVEFEDLNIEILGKYFNIERLKEINYLLKEKPNHKSIKNRLLGVPKVGGVLRLIGLNNPNIKAIHEYYIYKSIEKGLSIE